MGLGLSLLSAVPSCLCFSCVPKIQSEKEKITNRRRRLCLLDILFAVPSSLKTIVDSWLQRKGGTCLLLPPFVGNFSLLFFIYLFMDIWFVCKAHSYLLGWFTSLFCLIA
ncbi:uncharacterized protein LOC126606650 [Malus sylvestris]|uniref:uncharacterized protein LOC126587884 n=1 Tax=Malus sylvestris TaxID=3752 RepID=UPI0021AC3C2E|nr:uncharacterized protein LOC126587884 [Malus sylvestris]XP_050129988.1 uncharacterized protein LOC126606650 [Malus sylvestris]